MELLRNPDAPLPVDSTSVVWSDARLLGYAPMDATHEEFYRVVQQMLACDEHNALEAMRAFEHHAVEHFEQEDEWMRSTEFPPRDCHIKEHGEVLRSAREVLALVKGGQAGPDLVRDLALHLFQWFPGHADYLDSALVAWLSKRAYGGKPVVLRRDIIPKT
jgi:hemerythrin